MVGRRYSRVGAVLLALVLCGRAAAMDVDANVDADMDALDRFMQTFRTRQGLAKSSERLGPGLGAGSRSGHVDGEAGRDRPSGEPSPASPEPTPNYDDVMPADTDLALSVGDFIERIASAEDMSEGPFVRGDRPSVEVDFSKYELDAMRGVVSEEVMRDVEQVMFFGDLHGDPMALRGVVKMLKLSEREKERTLIVSTGDFMDRGPEDLQIWRALWNLRREGYKMVFVNGNHEAMAMSGNWKYRNLVSVARRGARMCADELGGETRVRDCGKYFQRAVDEDKRSMITCDGSFNRFVRDVMTPVALLQHPSHRGKILISHGGVSESFVSASLQKLGRDLTMGEWVSKVNQGFHRAAEEMCSGAEVKDFDPQVNSLPIWDDRINRGTFDPWTRIYQNPRGHLDSLWKEEVAVDCDDPDCFSPSWDRSLYQWTFRAGMCDSTTVDSLKSFIEANLRGVDGSVRQVVGHTKANQPVRTDPEGLLFGIDSSMSRGLCSRDSPCVYSVLVMKNFGSPEWESDPIIYRKTMQLRSWMGFEGSVLQCDKFGDHDMDGMILSDPNPHAWSTVTCASIGESVDGAADQAPEPADPPTKRITETRPSTPAEEVPVKATGATFVMLDPTGSTAAETDSELMKELKRRKARAARRRELEGSAVVPKLRMGPPPLDMGSLNVDEPFGSAPPTPRRPPQLEKPALSTLDIDSEPLRRELEGSGGDGVEDPPVPKLRMRPPSLDILSLNADNLPAPETKMKPPSLDVLSLNNADESVGAAPSTPRSESPPPRKLKKLRKPARGRDIDRVLEELMNPSDTQNGA